MSSINAQENCENAPGNPGEFRYTLTVQRTDEFDNDVIIGTRRGSMSLHDGDVEGATSEPVRFRVPAEPGAAFTVEYTVGEYDGDTADMERHSWSHHVLDRDDEHLWAAGHRSYDTYAPAAEPGGESYGILKFTTWSTRDQCKGYARYIVRWTPVYAGDDGSASRATPTS